MEFFIYLLILLITGIFVGFASGLLGVGGGFIMVPIQFWLLTSMGVDPTIAIRIAFGTSLAVILPTAISGAIAHKRKNFVLFKPMLYLGITGFVGGILGGLISTNAPAAILKPAFGLLALLAAIRMILPENMETKKESVDNPLYFAFWGFLIGMVSGVFGVGGGVLMVPVLVILLRFNIRKAIGTSTAVIIFTSIGGILSYVLYGLNMPELPPFSLGYVNLLQLIILAASSIPLAQFGAKTSHKLPEKQLRYIFAVLMIYIALKMIGVF